MTRESIPQDWGLRLQLAVIAGNEPESSLIEIRPLPGRQWWRPVRDLASTATLIEQLARDRDVFIGAAPRTCQSGKADAVGRVWALWADCDSPKAVERLRRFRPLPSIVVRSGTAGHLHAWWPLRKPLSPDHAVMANRRLARALNADRSATDAARVMRPIGSLNHKHRPPAPVECVRLELDVFRVVDVVRGLPADREPPRRPATRTPIAASGCNILGGLVAYVRSSIPHDAERGRNISLNWASYRAGEHVSAGRLDGAEVEAALLEAALEVGLDEPSSLRTIASGLDAGTRKAAA